MANSYITVVESTGGYTCKFKAVKMVPVIETTRNVEKTASGSYDITYGGVYESFDYVLRVPYTVSDTSYGWYDRLKTILKRNNPNANPTPFFSMTDHWGIWHTNCKVINAQVALQPICTIIDGNNTWYMVEVQIAMGTTTT